MRVFLCLFLLVAALIGRAQAQTRPEFRLDISNELRNFAQTTYCSVNSVSDWRCPTCAVGSLANFEISHRFVDPYTNTFGFAGLSRAVNEKVIIFSFRGATPERKRNWITDMTSQMTPYPGLKGAAVHKSFYKSYTSIADQIQLAARALLAQCKRCHIYVTGHSLGGAIATLAAGDLYSLTPDITLYTYGSPRVGNLKFASYMDRILPDSFRIVNNQDLVPHLPQRFIGYRHIGHEVWFYDPVRSSSKYRVCLLGEDDSCSNSIELHMDKSSIRDHAYYLDQPMGCQKADLTLMGIASQNWYSFLEQPSNPIEKLSVKTRATESQPETETALVETDSERGYNSEDLLEALADARADRLALTGGKKVYPARVLDPLSRPDLAQLSKLFSKVEQKWHKMPFSWNPKIKSELLEAKWNAENKPPK
jgi:hypothetical protein